MTPIIHADTAQTVSTIELPLPEGWTGGPLVLSKIGRIVVLSSDILTITGRIGVDFPAEYQATYGAKYSTRCPVFDIDKNLERSFFATATGLIMWGNFPSYPVRVRASGVWVTA